MGVKISNLPVIPSSPELTDIIAEVQPATSGTTYKVTLQQILDLFLENLGIVEMANGGTGNSLSPNENGIVYSTDTNLDILDTANNGVLVTNSSGDPSISDTLPLEVQNNISQLAPQTSNLNMNTHSIQNVVDPVDPQDAATKAYVDLVAQGLNVLPAAYAGTLSNLNATYDNGASGVGATLTDASGTFAVFSIDGTSPPLNSNILVKDQTNAFENGLYELTTNGDGVSVPWVLTRQTYYDQSGEIAPGDFVIIENGSQANSGWIENAVVTTIGTDDINFSLFYAQTSQIQDNLIYGGNFDTNPWQRGTTFLAVANDNYTADRFNYQNGGGTAVVNIAKIADAPTVEDAGLLVNHCLGLTVVSTGTAENYFYEYNMEGYDWSQLAQRSFTLSFFVKSTKTGIACVTFNNSGGDQSYVAEYTINSENTWEFKTITVPASPSSGTWNYTNGIGIQIRWIFRGNTLTGTADGAWHNTFGQPTSNQVNILDTNSNIFRLALVKVEAGVSATDYPIEPLTDVLERCQRYYCKTFPIATTPASSAGEAGSLGYRVQIEATKDYGLMWYYPTRMRTTPTLTAYNPSASGSTWRNITDGVNSGAFTPTATSDTSVLCTNTQVLTDTTNDRVCIHLTADAEL